MFRRCRLCKKQAVDGSMFCSDHRRQAEAFAASFGPQDRQGGDTPRDPSPVASTEPTEPEAVTQDPAEPEAASTEPAEPKTVTRDAAEPSELEALMQNAAESVSEWAARQRRNGVARRPQISIYSLNGTWHARAYFSIVPPVGEQDRHHVTYDWARARAALAPGQPVYEELARQFEMHARDLEAHRVQTLDIHFLDYAGLISIRTHSPGEPDANLATFVLDGERFCRTEVDDVQSRPGTRRNRAPS